MRRTYTFRLQNKKYNIDYCDQVTFIVPTGLLYHQEEEFISNRYKLWCDNILENINQKSHKTFEEEF